MRVNSQHSQRVQTANKHPVVPTLQIAPGKSLVSFAGGIDSLIRTKTANFNDSEMRKTKYLVDKISGKYNIDKRYLNNNPGEERLAET